MLEVLVDGFVVSVCLSAAGIVIFVVQEGGCRAERQSQAEKHPLIFEPIQPECPRGGLPSQETHGLEI